MSSKSKKSGRKTTTRPIGDVTINDFADATKCTNRAKKGVSSVTSFIKQQQQIDNRTWDEKVDEYDDAFDFVKEEDDEGKIIFVIQRQPRNKENNNNIRADKVQYPLDIWFLISDFIRPEDIGRFAGICKSTYAVINSARFWFKLYKRYYISTINLPERLQPDCMVRLYGLKACVTRALFFMYRPFSTRIIPLITYEDHGINHLLKRQCVLMWYQKRKDKWLYYFKLKERMCSVKKKKLTEKPDLIKMLEDVSANVEFGCRILLVSCMYFVPISPIIGLTLATVSFDFSQGCRRYGLQLGFGSGLSYTARPPDATISAEVVFDPVINVKVLDWWHPLYPHSQTTPLLLNQE